ncbi:MAG: septum site-determining protein MinC [Lachnospiraceae bacterium]|nr:septum site-determining protein MinC [Lachnospiraceae bacterium]
MKENVVIKKFPNGINLFLNPELEFEELLTEISNKFQQNRNFFRDAKVALGIEGRAFSDEEERKIVNVIHESSEVRVICIVGKNEETNRTFIKAIKLSEIQTTDNTGRFFRGTLKNNNKLETESSIVILGDVYPGSSVTATKDIIILGGLYGEAYAGASGESGHFVAALEMSPEKLKIGDFRYRQKEKTRWGIKPKIQPKIAYVKDNKIVSEPITKELLEVLIL